MNAQRLKRIEEIFQAAVEVSIAEREEFFVKSCDTDEDLRREVESLLAFEDNAESFLNTPPQALAAEFFSSDDLFPFYISFIEIERIVRDKIYGKAK